MDLGLFSHLLTTGWSFDPPVILGIAFAAFLYWRGVRYSQRRGLGRHLRRWRAVLFGCGLVTIFLALESPIDYWGGYYFWAHMLQHQLLELVAAPLILFGAPAWPIWRAVPLNLRRSFLRWALRQSWSRGLIHFMDKRVFAPVTAWLLFAGIFTIWHLPFAYDLALENQTIHDLEHLTFLATALLFWAQVIPSRPLRPRLSYIGQILFLFLAAVEGGLLNIVFMFSPYPIYPYYIALAQTRPAPLGTATALLDQQAGGGVMDIFVGFVFLIAIMSVIGVWLAADEKADDVVETPHQSARSGVTAPETGVSARSA